MTDLSVHVGATFNKSSDKLAKNLNVMATKTDGVNEIRLENVGLYYLDDLITLLLQIQKQLNTVKRVK